MEEKNLKTGQDPQPPILGGKKKNFAFDNVNFLLLAIGMVVIIIGFVLMSGGESTREAYDPSIFSAMRIKVAPVVCLVGFVSIIYAIIRRPKGER